MPKIVFTGGHHNSALSVASELKLMGVAEIVWFGHKYSMLGDTSESSEYREVVNKGIKFYDLKAGKFYKTYHPVQIARIPWGLLQAFYLLIKEKPDLIVSFGGYLAVPVVVAGWFLRIPSITHEQTVVSGLANRVVSRFAKRVFVTWPQSVKYFPGNKVVLTGLPLRESLFKFNEEHRYFENTDPVLYITGGKQGSHVINRMIGEVLPDLLKEFNVIHQCGGSTKTGDLIYLTEVEKKLPTDMRNRYILRQYVFEEEIGQVFHESSLVISRSGAHIVYELAALGIPALFIPIPWASHNEQYKNARLLANIGLAQILPEDQLSGASLVEMVQVMIKNISRFRKKADEVNQRIIFNGRERIVNEIKGLLSDYAS